MSELAAGTSTSAAPGWGNWDGGERMATLGGATLASGAPGRGEWMATCGGSILTSGAPGCGEWMVTCGGSTGAAGRFKSQQEQELSAVISSVRTKVGKFVAIHLLACLRRRIILTCQRSEGVKGSQEGCRKNGET